MKRFIYLDNAATTKTRPEVVDAMLPYFMEFYGNPSSVYEFSNESKKAINRSRETIATPLEQKPMRFTLQREAPSPITGHWPRRLRLTRRREITLLPVKLNTMRFFTHANIWRSAVSR